MPEQNPIRGAMGGWWRYSSILDSSHPFFIRVEAPNGIIAEADISALSSTWYGGLVQSVDYKVELRYYTPAKVTLSVTNPLVDPATGKVVNIYDGSNHLIGVAPRSDYTAPFRWALVFQCSTWTGSSYLPDGFVKLYLDNSLLLSATGKTIPRNFTSVNQNLHYIYGVQADLDRVWARNEPILLSTDSTGAPTSGLPSDLFFFDEFDGGSYSSWETMTLMSGFSNVPYSWSDAGGGGTWGLSGFSCGPYESVGTNPVSGIYAAIHKYFAYPLEGEPPPPPGPINLSQLPVELLVGPYDLSGIYSTSPVSTGAPTPPNETHDIYYNRAEIVGTGVGDIAKKIPDPTIRTALFGE